MLRLAEILLEHDFVGLDRASALQRFLSGKASRIGKPLRLRVQLRSFDAVCRMVEAGVGLGIVPETTAERAARTMAIHTVTLEDSWAARDLTLCIRSLKDLPPSARQLAGATRVLCLKATGVFQSSFGSTTRYAKIWKR